MATPQLLLQLLLQLVQNLLRLHQLLLLLAAVLLLPGQLLLVVAIAVAAVEAAQAIQVAQGALARQAKGLHLLEAHTSPQVEVTSSPQAWVQVPLETHTNPRQHSNRQIQMHI